MFLSSPLRSEVRSMRRKTRSPRRPSRRPTLAKGLLRAGHGSGGGLAQYRTLAAFYGDDPRRAPSREIDVRLWWREHADDPLHRAAWVAATGELYAVRLGPARGSEPAVELLAIIDDERRVESALAGWRARCGEAHSLAWLRRRAAAAGARERASRSAGAQALVALEPVVGDRLP